MSAPTPMPWHADGLAIESARHGNIGIVNLARASKADARLIAAAPELLDALRAVVGRGFCECKHPASQDYVSKEAVAKVRAAIAKAGVA